MVISTIADGVMRGVENVAESLSAPFRDRVIRLGVTGLSRAGKTVFITSLVANLMDRGRMGQLSAVAKGRIEAAYLQPQPDDTLPRFAYEDHLAALMGPTPHWPRGTRRISQLRLSLRVQPSGLLGGFQGPRTIHLDIVDYPGEWLLDLGLMELSYAQWSERALERMAQRAMASKYLAISENIDPKERLAEPKAQELAQTYTAYLEAAREAGFSDLTPGRFLLPGDLEGSPVLTFAPMHAVENAPRKSLIREMERRYNAYKRKVVTPFFRNHFAKIDRQIVLVDVLSAINAGPQAMEDLRQTMADILAAFRPGGTAFLRRMFGSRRVERILFAATKADHLHHVQHPQLTAITEALLREAKNRADFAGAMTTAMSIAALRTTTEGQVDHEGEQILVVRGLLADGRQAALHPGMLPDDPAKLLALAKDGAEAWHDEEYSVMQFEPVPLSLKPGDGPPHIRLDKAAEFLIGDRL